MGVNVTAPRLASSVLKEYSPHSKERNIDFDWVRGIARGPVSPWLANRYPTATAGGNVCVFAFVLANHRLAGEAPSLCRAREKQAGLNSKPTCWKNPALGALLHVGAARLCQSPAVSHFLPIAPQTPTPPLLCH